MRDHVFTTCLSLNSRSECQIYRNRDGILARLPLIKLILPQKIVVVDHSEESCARQAEVHNIFDANVLLSQDDVNQLVRQDRYCSHRQQVQYYKEIVICID